MNRAAKYTCFIAGYKAGRLKGWQNKKKNVIIVTSFYRNKQTKGHWQNNYFILNFIQKLQGTQNLECFPL